MSFQIEVSVEVDVEYTAVGGTPDKFSKSHGNWLPGDPEDTEDIRAYALVPIQELVKALQEAYAREGEAAKWARVNLIHSLSDGEAQSVKERCELDSQEVSDSDRMED